MAKGKTKREPESGRVPRVQGLQRKEIKVEFVIPETPPIAIFANQLVAQTDGRTAYLSLFLTQPPMLVGEREDVQKQFDELESLKAHMVAQVIVPQDRMADFMKVLKTVFDGTATKGNVVDSSRQDSSK